MTKTEIEIKLKILVECDGEKLEAIHGEKWMDCFRESAHEFACDLQQYADKHPFTIGCKMTETLSPNEKSSESAGQKTDS